MSRRPTAGSAPSPSCSPTKRLDQRHPRATAIKTKKTREMDGAEVRHAACNRIRTSNLSGWKSPRPGTLGKLFDARKGSSRPLSRRRVMSRTTHHRIPLLALTALGLGAVLVPSVAHAEPTQVLQLAKGIGGPDGLGKALKNASPGTEQSVSAAVPMGDKTYVVTVWMSGDV